MKIVVNVKVNDENLGTCEFPTVEFAKRAINHLLAELEKKETEELKGGKL